MVYVAHPMTESGEVFDRDVWLASLKALYAPNEVEVLTRALDISLEDPSFPHNLGTANVLIGLRMDYQTVAAALVPHVLDGERLDALRAQLGPDIARLAEGVARMGQLHLSGMDVTLDADKKNPVNQAESLRKMLLAMAEDVRVVLVILADQVRLLRTLVKTEELSRERLAHEAQEIFAPLANRLGIWQVKWELEDLALRILEPVRYKELAHKLDERRVDREAYIDQIIAILRKELGQVGIRGEISGRPKHINSIWRKMRKKGLDFEQVYDIRAVRVLVDDVRDCYTVLGIVHGLWQPIPGEFDDYIAHPKPNDYQSLHTAVIGPEGRALEVQIRTIEMHRHAEFGVAAHWRYKEGGQASRGFDEKIAWLRQLLAWKDEIADVHTDAAEWVEQFKTELFQDRVYVLTPQGKVIDLPQGATPLDFAYAVHTDLGHRCRGAKIDGHIVPLTYKLRNAQRVEILTAKQGQPSRDWLAPEYLVTSRARAKVRAWFHHQHYEDNLAHGREILDRELHRLHVTGFNQDKLLQKFHYPKLDDFLAALGRGEITPNQTALAIQELAELKPAEPQPPARPKRPARSLQGDVIIEGVGSLQVSYGKCCKPVPPDSIVGYVTRVRGVVIHRSDCGNVAKLSGEREARLLAASWNTGGNALHAVDLAILANERPGLLRDILAMLTAEKISTLAVNSETGGGLTDVRLSLEVRDQAQLHRVMAELKKVVGVRSAKRVI